MCGRDFIGEMAFDVCSEPSFWSGGKVVAAGGLIAGLCQFLRKEDVRNYTTFHGCLGLSFLDPKGDLFRCALSVRVLQCSRGSSTDWWYRQICRPRFGVHDSRFSYFPIKPRAGVGCSYLSRYIGITGYSGSRQIWGTSLRALYIQMGSLEVFTGYCLPSILQ